MVDMVNDVSAVGLEGWLAAPLLQCDDSKKLRKVACGCARLAIEQCEHVAADLLDAISLAEEIASGTADANVVEAMRREIELKVAESETREMEAQLIEGDGLEQRLRSLQASAVARAYSCVSRTLHQDARWAAATAAYEVGASLGIAAEVSELQKLWEVITDETA